MKPKPLRLVAAALLIPAGWLAAAPGDLDNDGLRDAVETNTGVYLSASNTGTKPSVADTDGDSLPDGMELGLGTNPLDGTSKVQRPNIIFILADDLGYADLGCFGQNQRTGIWKFATPGLDSMAAEGTKLTQHYALPMCAPSRCSLLQGQHQGHAGVRDVQFDFVMPNNHTMASTLKRAGYRTIHIGKAGLAGKYSRPLTASTAQILDGHPLKRGFDKFFGYLSHDDGHEHYPRNGTTSTKTLICDDYQPVVDAYPDLFTSDAWTAFAKKSIIEEAQQHPERPFFIYLAYDTPHFYGQYAPTANYPTGRGLSGGLQWTGAPGYASTAIGDAARVDNPANFHPSVNSTWYPAAKKYVSMVRRIDDSVSDLLQTLRDLGIDQNTLVVFSSDNGPAETEVSPTSFGSYGPFEGIKGDVWEGGIRVPTIAWWPGTIPGTNQLNNIREVTRPSGNWDWLATFSSAARMPSPSFSDGVSLLPVLTGQGQQADRGYLYFEYQIGTNTPSYFTNHAGELRGSMQAIRIGDFMGVRTQIQTGYEPFRIYNVETDQKQANNIAASRPDLQQRMKHLGVGTHRKAWGMSRVYDDAIIPATILPSATNGLNCKSYEGNWIWLPEFRDMPPVSQYLVPTISAAPRSRPEDVGLAFEGYLAIPTTGTYLFRTNSNSATCVWVDEARVVDNDYAFTTAKTSDPITLEAGLHPIRVHYRHQGGTTASLQLSYSGPGITMQPIPSSAFFIEGQPPELLPDTLNTKRAMAATANVLANDTSTLPLSLVSTGSTLLGTTGIDANQLKLTPTLGTIGYDELTYVATNGFSQLTSQVAATVLFDNEVWLPFEEGAGSSVNRVGGSPAVTGNLEGFVNPAAAWTTGRFHKALSFDGVDNHVDFPGMALPTGQQPRTFSCWVKTLSKSSPELQTLFSYGSNITGGRFIVRLDNQPNVASDQPLKLEVGSGTGHITGTTPLNDGVWHHVAVVVDNFDGSEDVNVRETKLWVDGVLDPVGSSDGRVLATGSTLVPCLGGSNHNDGYNFKGKLDDVRIFDRALSDAEVQELYLSQPIFLTVPEDLATSDEDGDGMSNSAEEIAGTDPDDSSSVLRIDQFTIAGGMAHLQWMAVQGRSYQVEESTNLQQWVPVPGQAPVSLPPQSAPSVLSVNIPASGQGPRYFRVKATLIEP
jgi:arylsulfatase A-like enzyme